LTKTNLIYQCNFPKHSTEKHVWNCVNISRDARFELTRVYPLRGATSCESFPQARRARSDYRLCVLLEYLSFYCVLI